MPSVGSFQHPSPQVPPQRINALHVPQMRRHGAAAGVVAPPLPQAGPGSNQVRARGLPPRSPDSTPVCAISLSSSLDVGSPRSPSGIPVVARPGQSSPQRSTVRTWRNQSWPLPRRRHARHRLDEGVRQSRPGHPGVGRFGMWFPRRSPDQTVRTSTAAFPRRLAWDTVGGPSAAPHRISRILSGPT